MVFLHLKVGLTLYVTPKQASGELKGPRRLLPPSKGEHLERPWTSQPSTHGQQGQPVGPTYLIEASGSPDSPTKIGGP